MGNNEMRMAPCDTTIEQYLKQFKVDMGSRQIEMSRAIAERQIAIQVAATRERMVWFVPMLVSSTIFLYRGYTKTKISPVLFPLIPMTFALVYQIDFAYGTKMKRVKDLADDILINEKHLLNVPDWHLDADIKMAEQLKMKLLEEKGVSKKTITEETSLPTKSILSGMPRLIRREEAHCSDK